MSNPAFTTGMNFGFSLGNMDFSSTSFNLGDFIPVQNNNVTNDNKENENKHKKGIKKGGQKDKRKQSKDVVITEKTNTNVEASELNPEDGEKGDSNSRLSKASKQIRKQTIQKLRKNAEKNFSGEGKGKGRSMNRHKGMKNLGPGKGLDPTLFFKTKICPHFVEGLCKRGDSCNYAHSQSEIKETPNLKKTKICQLFQIGKCSLGNLCSFAHGDQELRSTPDFFRTSLCNAYLKGNCKMGDKCRYAHGESELRTSTPMTNYTNSTFSREKEIPRNIPIANPFTTSPFNPIETSNNNTQPMFDNFNNTVPTLNNFSNVSLQNFSMPSTSQPVMGNPNMNNNFQGFGGFNLNPAPSATTQNQNTLANTSMFNSIPQNQPEMKRSVENKPPSQAPLSEGISFNTFNPEKLASLFNPVSSFYN